MRRLRNVRQISVIEFQIADIVRDELCQAIVSAYETESNPERERYMQSNDEIDQAGLARTLRA
jgi:phosphate starvation-inducible protein PhoH